MLGGRRLCTRFSRSRDCTKFLSVATRYVCLSLSLTGWWDPTAKHRMQPLNSPFRSLPSPALFLSPSFYTFTPSKHCPFHSPRFEPSFTKFGSRTSDTSPIIFCHGVFGSKINFSRSAKRLAADFGTECYLLDCRNHGASPWRDDMRLETLAKDLEDFVEQQNLGSVNIVGHR